MREADDLDITLSDGEGRGERVSCLNNGLPGRDETSAPVRGIAAAGVNTVTRPWRSRRPATRCGKQLPPGQHRDGAGRQRPQHPGRREQGVDRVVIEQGSEQRTDRRQVGHLRGGAGRDALGPSHHHGTETHQRRHGARAAAGRRSGRFREPVRYRPARPARQTSDVPDSGRAPASTRRTRPRSGKVIPYPFGALAAAAVGVPGLCCARRAWLQAWICGMAVIAVRDKIGVIAGFPVEPLVRHDW